MIPDQYTTIEIPLGYSQDENCVVLFSTDETDKVLGKIPIVIQGESLSQAKADYLSLLKWHIEHLEDRSRQLDLWKPFQKGDWSHTGGKWFTVFGIHVYFRYGKGMKYGWHVPFTKLNISMNNYWKRKYKTK